jgi:SAM-dependent methyltransferase
MRKPPHLAGESDAFLKYHQFRARLGMGDLHPGGSAASATILRWLSERNLRHVLEVGAGIGNTAARMASLSWDVTAIEPDPILFASLRNRPGIAARRESLLDHQTQTPYDAIVAESVFFQMDLPRAFAHARALLRPGGYLAFIEAVWTQGVTAATSRELHENTKRLFGIAVGSREPFTWQDWCKQLQECGFETEQAELLPRGSAGRPPTSDWPASVLGILRDPRLALWIVRYRRRKRRARMPGGVQESWLFLGRRVDP